MDKSNFEQFVQKSGKDILRFCRNSAGSQELGDELYQDTMLKLLENLHKLDEEQNLKGYAMSVAMLVQKNKWRKWAVRNKIACFISIENEHSDVTNDSQCSNAKSPEEEILNKLEAETVRKCIADMPLKYKQPLYLYYSGNMTVSEIAGILNIPLGTTKTRIRKAKVLLKKKLEDIGYDRS